MGFFATIYYLWGFINVILLFGGLFSDNKLFMNRQLEKTETFKKLSQKHMVIYVLSFIWLIIGLLSSFYILSIISIILLIVMTRLINVFDINSKEKLNIFESIFLFKLKVIYLISVTIPVFNAFHTKYNISDVIITFIKTYI